MVGRVIPSITQLELPNRWNLLEIKKQHVSAYHWPSSGIILNKAVRALYNYCKRALVGDGDEISTPMRVCNNCITLLQHNC